MLKTLERCSVCDEPTGKAGRGEDSIYIDIGFDELGPLCDECHNTFLTAIAKIAYTRPSADAAFLDALKIAQDTGAEIKLTPLMWEAVEKTKAARAKVRGEEG